MIDAALLKARRLFAHGDAAAARQAYLDALHFDPQHPDALTELGALAQAGGYVSAAREAFRQAVSVHPNHVVARIGYGDLLSEAGDPAAGCRQYRAALALDPHAPRAHQGIARALHALGEDAGEHWQKGFSGHAVVSRFRGPAATIALLMLVSAVGGNVPTCHWVDDQIFAVTAIYADFFNPADPLPPHAMILNVIGDADLCANALANAEQITARATVPVINQPAAVRRTGREDIARRLANIPGVTAPRIARLSQSTLSFPLLLRAPGYHTGQHFVRVGTEDSLAEAVAAMLVPDPLAIEYLDARGPDAMARKYRVMFVDGRAYPLHLAISADWKVHYFSAAMEAKPELRTEEQHFLENMQAVLGSRAMAALSDIQAVLGLDYAGIDFGLAPDGTLLLFEANATMVINPPGPERMWDYRRPAITAALKAAQTMLTSRVNTGP